MKIRIKKIPNTQNAKKWNHKHDLGGYLLQLGGETNSQSENKATPLERAIYNSVNPTDPYPGWIKAISNYIYAKQKVKRGEQDIPEYKVGNSLGEKVADAAWRKRLNIPYDTTYLPIWNGDTVRLPYELEMEIPTDTNFLKERIQRNKDLQESNSKYAPYTEYGKIINAAIQEDQSALDALRYTYATGKPVGLSEMSYNSRKLLNNGELDLNIVTPLNVLQKYNVRYDKNQNKMYYSDEYDFNQYERFVPGESFRIRGAIDLNNKAQGGLLKPFSYSQIPSVRY